MKHIIEQLNALFVIEWFAASFSIVALYVLGANTIVYLLVRKRINKVIRELMKRFLFKAPFVVTGYGFSAGLACYILMSLTDPLLNGTKANSPVVSSQHKTVLVLFTLFGFCFGTLVGLSSFFKAYKALNQHTKPEE